MVKWKLGETLKDFDEQAWRKVDIYLPNLVKLIEEKSPKNLDCTFVFSETPEGSDFWWGMLDNKVPLDLPRLKKVYKAVTGNDYDDATESKDAVNSPPHYGQGKIECIEYIEDFLTKEEYIGYLRGNIAKYLHRWRWKGKPNEDLAKAAWYLDRLQGVVKDD
jgi:hypothetical protein